MLSKHALYYINVILSCSAASKWCAGMSGQAGQKGLSQLAKRKRTQPLPVSVFLVACAPQVCHV